MKQILFLLTFIAFLMLSGCQTKTKPTSAFTKEVYTPEYAAGFDIMGTDNTEVRLFTCVIPGKERKALKCPTSWPGTGNRLQKILTV